MTPDDAGPGDEASDAVHADAVQGEIPEGLGPEVFRDRLERLRRDGAEHGAQIRLRDEHFYVEDIESVEEDEDDGGNSRVRLRNGVIIAGVTGAAIVAAIATVRYRRRRRQ